MDISGLASAASAASQAQTGDAVAIAVLKKATEIQEDSALQLLQALPQVNNPPHLGNSVDIRA